MTRPGTSAAAAPGPAEVPVRGDVQRRRRVLLVGKGAPDRGGIPTFLTTLQRSALAREHDLRFLNVAHSNVPQGGQVTTANIRRTLADAVAIWRGARDRDVVHIHSALVPTVTVVRAGMLAAAGRLRGCAVVVHAHGGNIETWLTGPARRLLLRLAMRPADRVVAVWTAGERALQGALGPGRVQLIDNGVDLAAAQPARGGHVPPRVLYVGLLTPRKGVLDLLEASRTLRAEGVAHELWLLGGTPDEGPEAEEAVRSAAGPGVRFLGTRPPDQMPAVYAQADVLCLPSWWEAMPLSVLEGMASGLPVVATDVGDVARAVADGVTGYVVPPRSPDRLAAALRSLLVDPRRRRDMGAAGRCRVEERFSDAVTARAVSALYAEIDRQRA